MSIVLDMGFPGGSVVKNPPASAGDSGSIPGLYSLEMFMFKGAVSYCSMISSLNIFEI